jgi:hypothetical protein
MGICKTLQPYGEFDITRANNVLNLKILNYNRKGINQLLLSTTHVVLDGKMKIILYEVVP